MYALSTERRAGHVRPRWGALPDVASSFINIGAVYAGKGDLENALCQFQKALEIQTRVFGSDHPDVADSKENIGLVFQKMTKKSEARQMFTEAAGIRRKVFGADHPLTKKSEHLAAQ